MRNFILPALLVLFVLSVLSVLFFNTNKRSGLVKVVITGEKEKAVFTVEVARDMVSRAKGLMFREELAENGGMLFVFQRLGKYHMWMKNTKIPLDILFADGDGKIVEIVADAVPNDMTSLGGKDNSLYILEINGGLAKKYDIVEGDTLKIYD